MIAFLADAWRHVLLHLWQTTLVVVPVLIAARLLRHAPARIVHALWLVALAKLVLPLVAFESLSSRAARAVFGHPSVVDGDAALVTLGSVRTLLDPSAALLLSSFQTWLLSIPIVVITALWLVTLVRRLSSALLGVRREALAHDRPARAEPVSDHARRVLVRASRLGIPKGGVRLSIDDDGARVTGLFRPVIVLPIALVVSLTDRELDAVLLHEDAHRTRHDPLRMLAVEVAAAFFGLYPLLGPIVRGHRRSTELVCDALAIARGAEPIALARALARSTLLSLPGRDQPQVALRGQTPLGERFARITEPRRYMSMRFHRVTFGLVALAALVVSFAPVSFLAGCTPAEDGQSATSNAPESEALASDVSKEAHAFDTPPVVKTQVAPEYPKDPRAEGVSGKVWVRITLFADGTVHDAVVERRSDEAARIFDEAALAAVRQWTFEPARQGDEPVMCQIVIPFSFKTS